ncbi:integrase catalytic domain-containing protein [Trichonephila clavipes]|nr:integrase catalytic domain-containing protein [Trichonephila clavipes]
MTFLKAETEGEERINLAMAGFGLGVDEKRQSFKKKVRDFPKEKIPTAANVLTTALKENVFLYWEALEPRLFSSSEDQFGWKTYFKREAMLFCLLNTKAYSSFLSENQGPKVEVNMANNTSNPRVFLQTLQLKMVCGTKEIPLSDVGEESRSVQVLLGSDVIGKLMTGQRRILSCGLVAMETILGWTLSGIQDPSEQKTKEELHRASMEHFLRTVKVDEEERFLVSLPWLDNHLPLPDNFNLAFKGLQVTTHKLKKENLFNEYGDVFKEWKREGIIEEVPKEELKHFRVVFGVSSSPFLLGSTIQYHLEKKLEEAKQGRAKYPECIVQKMMSSFYVDNCLASFQTQSELDRFIDVATEILAERKFDLRGWEHCNTSDPTASPGNDLEKTL